MSKKRRSTTGIILIIIGVIFFLKNFIDIPLNINWDYVWPIIVIVVGVRLLNRG